MRRGAARSIFALLTLGVALSSMTSARAGFCPGDCDEDGQTSAGDLRQMVSLGLVQSIDDCPAGDADESLAITIEEIVAATNARLQDCRPLSTSSATPTPPLSFTPGATATAPRPTPTSTQPPVSPTLPPPSPSPTATTAALPTRTLAAVLCADRVGGALITFSICGGPPSGPGERLTVWSTNDDFIDQAVAGLRTHRAGIPIFATLLDGRDCDAAWTWHPDPAAMQFAGGAIEVCDGCLSSVEEEKSYWLSLDLYCPWSALVIAVDDRRL